MAVVFNGANVEKAKAIKKGKAELIKNQHELAPRNKAPWQKIENLRFVDGNPVILDPKELTESDASEYDNLLNDGSDNTGMVADGPTVPSTSTENQDLNKKKVASVIVKRERENLVVKRPWAILAERDHDEVYVDDFVTKNFYNIANIKAWIKENITDFEEGKLFETLLSCDELFDNPGLLDHVNATDFRSEILTKNRFSNSEEIGCLVFFRGFLKDIFKNKSMGLALRNLSQETRHSCPLPFRKKIGVFIDSIVNAADTVYSESGRPHYELNRFRVEAIKNDKANFLTANKANSIPIEVYCKDLGWVSNLNVTKKIYV